MSIGSTIRQFFHELCGSRLADELKTVISAKENDILQLRQDFQARLQEKDVLITDQRSELAQCRNKIAQYELVLIPLSSAAGAQFGNLLNPKEKPTFVSIDETTSMGSWQKTQEEFYRQQDVERAAARLAAEENEKEVTNVQ